MKKLVSGFVAYPSQPASIPETIKRAMNKINEAQDCNIKTWQECAISGKLILDVICREIDKTELFIADITGTNPNVLFELGYAIAKQKRVWLLFDPSFSESKNIYEQLRFLTTVGYASYLNSNDIVQKFYGERPWLDLKDTIFTKSIAPALQEHEESRLLYLKSQHETEASIQLSRLVSSFNLPTILSDPKESSVQSLIWYVTKIWHAPGIIAHFSGEKRHGSRVHNSRYAFISGLAHGLQKPLLMLAETDYSIPIDYSDILLHYKTSSECAKFAQIWLEKISLKYAKKQKESREYAKKVALSADLRSFSLGEYIAENEEEILNEYFIETEPFLRVIERQYSIVVGRKGTGKTANLFMAKRRLSEDKRNMVCVIKPDGYDIQGVVRLGKAIKEKDKKGYLSETLWKFLIFSEIARTAYEEIKQLPYVDEKGPEGKLKELMEKQGSILLDDFPVRLERCVSNLSSDAMRKSLYDFRIAISEILHKNILHTLRNHLGDLLTKRKRVIILIDNLDKAWDRGDDLEHLSDFLFGLLSVAKSIPKEFAKHDYWRKPVNVSITIFLRSDIFEGVMKNAREPDKIPHDKLLWDDPIVLMRIIDERLAANREVLDPALLWGEVFCQTVKKESSKKYILDMILPRPRDLVYFTKAALSIAVNRGHSRVEEADILEAEKLYSQFAFEVIQVENGISLPELEKILFEFVGGSSILYKNEILKILSKSGIDKNLYDYALGHLIALSFLGVEIKLNEFRFCTSADEIQKIERLSERFVTNKKKGQRYQIHKAFHAYLEVINYVDGKMQLGFNL